MVRVRGDKTLVLVLSLQWITPIASDQVVRNLKMAMGAVIVLVACELILVLVAGAEIQSGPCIVGASPLLSENLSCVATICPGEVHSRSPSPCSHRNGMQDYFVAKQ